MPLWRFLACPAPGGGKPMDRFVQKLGVEAEANFTTLLDDHSKLERLLWTRPQFDILHGYPKMGEFIFKGDGKAYRVFCFFGIERHEFTLLAGHIKKRDLSHEMNEAWKRKDYAEKNPGILYEFRIETILPSETEN